MNILNQLNFRDRIVISFAMFGVVAFSYLLLSVSISTENKKHIDLKFIGNITTEGQDIRRKTVLSFLWSDIPSDSEVFGGDSIFTGTDSKALINLSSGISLNLEQNSLIKLNFLSDNMDLFLDFGMIIAHLENNKEIQITLNNKKVKLIGQNNAKISLLNQSSNSTRIKVLSGDIQLKDESSSSLDLKKNDTTLIDSNETLTKSENFEFLTHKNPIKIIKWQLTSSPTDFELKWESQGIYDHFKVILSDNPNFTKILKETKTSDNFIMLKENLKFGSYFWKVKAFDSNETEIGESEPYSFEAKNIATPQLLGTFPLMKFKDQKSHSNLKVKWSNIDDSSRFLVQISKSSDFSEILHSKETIENELIIPALEEGKYYLRVASTGLSRPASLFSSTGVIITRDTSIDPSLEVPQLLSKKLLFDPFIKSKRPFIKYSTRSKNQYYLIEFSKSDDFSDLDSSETTRLNQWEIKSCNGGQYYFRVSLLKANLERSRPSTTGDLYCKIMPPLIQPLAAISAEGKTWDDVGEAKTAKINWSSVPDTAIYKLEYSRKIDFSLGKVFEVKTTTMTIVIPEEGEYFFKVTPLDSARNPLTNSSPIQKLTYTVKKPLKVPELIEPKNEMTLFLPQGDIPNIWLIWSQSPNVTQYELQLSEDEDFTSTYFTMKTNSPKFLIQKQIPEGQTFWRVRSQFLNGQSSPWSEIRMFNLSPMIGNEDYN